MLATNELPFPLKFIAGRTLIKLARRGRRGGKTKRTRLLIGCLTGKLLLIKLQLGQAGRTEQEQAFLPTDKRKLGLEGAGPLSVALPRGYAS